MINVLICGLGAIGSIYAEKFSKSENINLKILVDEERFEKYKKTPTVFNGKELILDYILPNNTDFKADLVVIATKFHNFKNIISDLKNFVNDKTVIISLLNGITSEKLLRQEYKNVLISYFIGHSSIRNDREIVHDGVNTIIFGSDIKDDKNITIVKNIFEQANINYKISDNIINSLWLKFMLNVSLNQTSALFKMNIGEICKSSKAWDFVENLAYEVEKIAKAEDVSDSDKMPEIVFETIKNMPSDNKPSMLQDILANRNTEIDLFANTVINLAKKHNIDVPYNRKVAEIIKQ